MSLAAHPTRPSLRIIHVVACLALAFTAATASAEDRVLDSREILQEHCYACHAEGSNEGGFALDELLAGDASHAAKERWHKVLKKVQANLMPPPEEGELSDEESHSLESWIKYSALGIDAQDPDPGRVVIRRLNRVEYRNSVRDLLGVDYDTESNFPADDTGHGFDNIGEVLSMSPLLLEKYVDAAKEIVSSVVPVVPGVIRRQEIKGNRFRLDAQSLVEAINRSGPQRGANDEQSASELFELSYYQKATAKTNFTVELGGMYKIRLNLVAEEDYVDNQFDENSCRFVFALNDDELIQREFSRRNDVAFEIDFSRDLQPGDFTLSASVTPLSDKPQIRNLRLQIVSVEVFGPDDEKYFDRPDGYSDFFAKDVPEDADGRRAYARELLQPFASKAFRRPVDDDSLGRLVALAESVYSEGATFESGIAKAMTAVLASPQFLFREETTTERLNDSQKSSSQYPLVDEHALASRLSYFFWSSMPDDELFALAEAGKLRDQLERQVERMLADPKSQAFSENFVGQWLRSRLVESIQINTAAVLSREPKVVDPESNPRRRRFFALFRKGAERNEEENREYERAKEAYLRSFRGSPGQLNDQVRTAMRREAELVFDYIIDNNRSLLEFIDADYTFLNEALSDHYMVPDLEPISGDEMRMVNLPTGSFRGGVLTQGSTLVVTSNPDRTSPVKRGLFILENLLGTPPAAPPPNIPALEDVEPGTNRKLSLRETLAIHRENALCSSCHNQMDPLGLSLENFNALGRFRTIDSDQPVDAAGSLGPDEEFETIQELKRILVSNRSEEIYRCITEKMMTYALGRAVEYSDAHTVDEIVNQLKSNGGRAKSLIHAIVGSSAFQRTQTTSHN